MLLSFSTSAGIDFSLMSMADISVLTYGTFGLYASFLTKDKIRYYPKGEEPAANDIRDCGLQEMERGQVSKHKKAGDI